MWVKILAGVGAALLVVGVGVFLSMPTGGWGEQKCGGTCDKSTPPALTESEDGCCGACCSEKAICCADETAKPEFGAGLAACLGGVVTTPQPEQTQPVNRVGAKARAIAD